VTSRAANLLFFDNGRGDITELADPITGAVVAHVECSPFGKLLVSSGPLADANPYRFSSKEHDATALAYYGYRYYSPELGRWINRDPIGERGGFNVYAFASNATLLAIDANGLRPVRRNCREFPWNAAFGGGILGYWSVAVQADVLICDCCYDGGEYLHDAYAEVHGRAEIALTLGAGFMWDVTFTLPDSFPYFGGRTYTWSAGASVSTWGGVVSATIDLTNDCRGNAISGAICANLDLFLVPFSGTAGIGGIAQLRWNGAYSVGANICLDPRSHRLSGTFVGKYDMGAEYRLISATWTPLGGPISSDEDELLRLFDVQLPW
jgi:RHS repeat-associated protein